MPLGGPHQIDVIAGRQQSPVALFGGLRQRVRPAPGLNDDAVGQVGAENFVPSQHGFSVLADDLLHSLVEIGLQIIVVLQAVGAHEFLDLWVGVPLLAVYFVASDVKELVGKEPGHLANKFVEKLVSLLASRIHGGIEHAPLALDFIRPRPAGQFGIADEPGSTVAGHIEFRNHADAALMRVSDQVADFVLGVVETIRTHFAGVWEMSCSPRGSPGCPKDASEIRSALPRPCRQDSASARRAG